MVVVVAVVVVGSNSRSLNNLIRNSKNVIVIRHEHGRKVVVVLKNAKYITMID